MKTKQQASMEAVEALETWLTSPKAGELIDGYQIGGQTLFTFNAEPKVP